MLRGNIQKHIRHGHAQALHSFLRSRMFFLPVESQVPVARNFGKLCFNTNEVYRVSVTEYGYESKFKTSEHGNSIEGVV